MPNACTACQHSQRGLIDSMLIAGRPYRGIASRLGLSKDAVRRHAQSGHVAGGPIPEPFRRNQHPPHGPIAGATTHDADDGDADTDPDGQVTPAQALHAAMRTLRSMDIARMSPATIVSHADAIRRISDSLAKAEPKAPEKVSLDQVEGMAEFVQLLFEVLEEYPEARERLKEEMEARRIFPS